MVVGHGAAGARRERRAGADRLRRAPQPGPERQVGRRLAPDPHPLAGDEVEQDHRAQLVGVARRVGLASRAGRWRGTARESSVASSPSNSTKRSSARPAGGPRRAGRGRARPPRRSRRRRRWRRRSRAGPWCRSARAISDRRPRARDPPDDVAQPRMARHALEAAARQLAPQSPREPAQRGRARRTRAQLDLAAQLGERARGVEAIALGGGPLRRRGRGRIVAAGERDHGRDGAGRQRGAQAHDDPSTALNRRRSPPGSVERSQATLRGRVTRDVRFSRWPPPSR